VDVRGAVLAGGAASRFGGKPKGLEQVGGERILDRAIRAVQLATGEAPLLVANVPEAADWRPDLELRRDALQSCGSLGGIYTALSAAEGPVLVLAWDMPFVPPELLQSLVKQSQGFDAFLPESPSSENDVEPLCAVYHPTCLAHIRRNLADEDFRVQGFLESVRAGTLPSSEVTRYGDPDVIFFNVNTPDDLQQAQELWSKQR
jgi:molybdopterin-guanine dinucleotide biosynthesis protein A